MQTLQTEHDSNVFYPFLNNTILTTSRLHQVSFEQFPYDVNELPRI